MYNCKRCGSKEKENFFSRIYTICKDCINKIVKDDDLNTFIPILKENDIPYIEKYWNQYLKNKQNDKTIIGKYTAYLQSAPFRGYKWLDSDFLNFIEEGDENG